jgi:hypothetical protein
LASVRELNKINKRVVFQDKAATCTLRIPIGHSGSHTQEHFEAKLFWQGKGKGCCQTLNPWRMGGKLCSIASAKYFNRPYIQNLRQQLTNSQQNRNMVNGHWTSINQEEGINNKSSAHYMDDLQRRQHCY